MLDSPRSLLRGAALCAAAFALLLAVVYASWWARWLDATAMDGFLGLQRPYVAGLSERLAHLGDPAAVGLLGLAFMALALARGRPRYALAVLFLLAVTSVSSQLLKALLDYPRYEALLIGPDVRPAAFPSGHATAAMSLALAGVLVAPRRVRPLAAVVGTGFALAVSYSIVSLDWHFPSDVVGGFLLATVWALVTAAALQAAAARWPERSGRRLARARITPAVDKVASAGIVATAWVGVAVAAAVAAPLLMFRLPELVGYAANHTWFVLVAAAIAGSAALLLTWVTAVLVRRG
jgi:membrane-associated phospholipid phosphatase